MRQPNMGVRLPAEWIEVVLLVVLLNAGFLCACNDPNYVEIVGPNGAVRARLSVEVANTPALRALGLMYRKHLDPNAGMLFVFKSPTQANFWMKNTLIPLDLVFADEDGRILGIVPNAEPMSQRLLGIEGLSKFVLEVNGGFCKDHAIAPGDRLKFVNFKPVAED